MKQIDNGLQLEKREAIPPDWQRFSYHFFASFSTCDCVRYCPASILFIAASNSMLYCFLLILLVVACSFKMKLNNSRRSLLFSKDIALINFLFKLAVVMLRFLYCQIYEFAMQKFIIKIPSPFSEEGFLYTTKSF